jgi:hypothetical protein
LVGPNSFHPADKTAECLRAEESRLRQTAHSLLPPRILKEFAVQVNNVEDRECLESALGQPVSTPAISVPVVGGSSSSGGGTAAIRVRSPSVAAVGTISASGVSSSGGSPSHAHLVSSNSNSNIGSFIASSSVSSSSGSVSNSSSSSGASDKNETLLVCREVHAPGKDIAGLSATLNEYMVWTQTETACLQYVQYH